MIRPVLLSALAATILSLASAAQADHTRIERYHLNEDRFHEVAVPIRQSFQPGGSLERLGQSARNEVLQGLDQIERILADDSGNERARERRLSREVERVNMALATETTTADGSDIVCRRERTIGSNMPQRVCRSRAELEADRETVRDTIRDLDHR